MDRSGGRENRFARARRGSVVAGLLAAALSLVACERLEEARRMEDLQRELDSLVTDSGAEVGIFYQDLGDGTIVAVNPDLRMHAASTMKIAVMMRLFLDRDAGLLSLNDSLEVTTTFHSIVDGSPFTLPPESDSETSLYELVGERVSLRRLVEAMITVSSNLATNLLIRELKPERVTALVRELGADSMEVLRGVEDLPAFRAGLSNTVTARDLGALLAALGKGAVGSPVTSREMVDLLLRQEFNTMIPAGLPEGVPVAHKTGSITGIRHDAALVFPPDAAPFVLVILTRSFSEQEAADAFGALVARRVYGSHVGRRRG